MSGSSQDTSQWLSVTEDTLFMHDGIVRVSDLVELPIDIGSGDGEEEQELISFDSKSPKELSDRLLAVCGTQNNAYTRLLEYRLSAVKGLWKAQIQVAHEEDSDRETASKEDTIALLKKQGIWKEPDPASFSTRVSLLLVLPLIQSQSKFDPTLGGITGELLLNCLGDCTPLSLSKEPSDCLNGIETLLCTWLEGDGNHVQPVSDQRQRKNAAAALVALASARGHLKTFIHTVHLLQSLDGLDPLQVSDILQKLLEMEGGQGQPTAILGSKHVMCWGFEDMLVEQEKEESTENTTTADNKVVELEIGRRLATDGKYLFMTSKSGHGVAKIGSGLFGTLRGYVYAKNHCIPPGFLTYGNNLLVHRPVDYDKEENSAVFLQIISPDTLLPIKVVPRPDMYLTPSTGYTTVGLCSDGIHFYWLWCLGTASEKNAKGQVIQMETFKIQDKDLLALSVRAGVIVQKKEDATSKTLNEALLSRLRPYRSPATAATLVALTGGESPITKKKKVPTATLR